MATDTEIALSALDAFAATNEQKAAQQTTPASKAHFQAIANQARNIIANGLTTRVRLLGQ
jgi:hypothetical protein